MIETVELYKIIQQSLSLPQIKINQPCLIMAQKNKENLVSMAVAEIEGGLIKKIFNCGKEIPSPADASRTGEYPGLKPLTKEEAKKLEEIKRNTIRRQLTWFNSPRHSYLRVTREDLITLNVWSEISPFSYGGKDFAYLEEDCDAGIFVETAKNAEWSLSFEHIDVPTFPYAKTTGEKIQRLEEDPRCHWCQEEREKSCDCEAPKCPICSDTAAVGNLEEIALEHLSCNYLLAGWENEEFISSI